MPLNAPPNQTGMLAFNGVPDVAWSNWFDLLWKRVVGKIVIIPVSPAGVTPTGEVGQAYLTSTGVLATFNGTSWVKYDGTPVVF